MQHEKMRRLVLAAMFAAITAVTAQLVIPLGFTPVPFTLALIAIFLTGALLDPKSAFQAPPALRYSPTFPAGFRSLRGRRAAICSLIPLWR